MCGIQFYEFFVHLLKYKVEGHCVVLNNVSSCINPLTPNELIKMSRSEPFKNWNSPVKYAWKINKYTSYSFSLLIMYGSSYMFRHCIAILRERS
jgi:hypothetical protein